MSIASFRRGVMQATVEGNSKNKLVGLQSIGAPKCYRYFGAFGIGHISRNAHVDLHCACSIF